MSRLSVVAKPAVDAALADIELYKAELKLEADERLKCFEIACKTRMDEIQLFISRSNYFLVLQTALAIAVFSGKIADVAVSAALCFVGMAASFLWLSAGLSSKYWQSRWEQKAAELESQLFGNAYQMFNESSADVQAGVKRSLSWHEHGPIRRAHDWLVLRKPSVTFSMFALSLLFVIAWAVIFLHTISFQCLAAHVCFVPVTK